MKVPPFNVFGFTILSSQSRLRIFQQSTSLLENAVSWLKYAAFGSPLLPCLPQQDPALCCAYGTVMRRSECKRRSGKHLPSLMTAEQDWEIRLTNTLGPSYISNSQLDWTTCSTALVSMKQHFMVLISSLFFSYSVRITEKILHAKFSSASLTLVFFNFCQNYSLVKGKPSSFVHCRCNLAKLHS